MKMMEVQQILKWADELVRAQTGKHLDDVQEAILRGSAQGQKYSEIAKSYNCSEPHLKKKASLLWRILSEKTGEDINKSNLRSTFKRLQVSCFCKEYLTNFVEIEELNVFSNSTQFLDEAIDKQENTSCLRRVDLSDVPDVTYFCDRPSELASLKNWILQERARLVAILGISGMGKTAIALHLLSQIQDNFDFVIWRSLHASPPLEALLEYLIEFLPPPEAQGEEEEQAGCPFYELEEEKEQVRCPFFLEKKEQVKCPFFWKKKGKTASSSYELKTQLSLIMERLRQYRCLIILDDLNGIFDSEKIAGCYRPGYENYGLFFKTIGELSHNSCLTINTWTPPPEIAELTNNNAPVRCLPLSGLGKAANNILKEAGLLDEDKWQDLIEIYGGNPSWLKSVASTIKEFFDGKVGEYLQKNSPLLSCEITMGLDLQFKQLSELENQVISILAKEARAVSISELLKKKNYPHSDLLLTVQSLKKRFLIQTFKRADKTMLAVLPAIKEYLLNRKNRS